MEIDAESVTSQVAVELNRKLAEAEDAETAIAVYKMANWIISQLEEVKKAAISLAEEDMQQQQINNLKTPVGSAGWTQPRIRQLDEGAWQDALVRSPHLMAIQRDFDVAQAALREAQEPYLKLPESRFFIR
jgi:hypothetical protein